jgi:hypothetical protein
MPMPTRCPDHCTAFLNTYELIKIKFMLKLRLFTTFSFVLIVFIFQVKSQVFNNLKDLEIFESKMQVRDFVGSFLHYPFESLKNKEMGVVIGGIILGDSLHNDRFFISNSVSDNLDKGFLNALKLTSANYNKSLRQIASNDSLFFYAIFMIENNDFEITYKNIPSNLIGPIKMILDNKIESTNPSLAQEIKAKPDSYYISNIERLLAKNKSVESQFSNYSKIRQSKETIFIKSRYKKAIENVTELIHRNPFNPELFIQRAGFYEKINQIQQSKADYEFIIKFLNNTSQASIAKERLNK